MEESKKMNNVEEEMKKKINDDNFPSIFQMYLKKLDEFEHGYNEKIRRKRQRALCLLDVVPNYRKSHVRLFVSSRYDISHKEYVLSFECRPLVGPSFETTSASLMDQDTRKKSMTLEKKNVSSSLVELNPMSIPLAWNISNRKTNGTTLQEDEVKFTNLWERIQICFQQREKVSTLEWKQSKLRGEHQQNQYSFQAFLQDNLNNNNHSGGQQSSPAVATICLYKEPTDTKNYIPTQSLCQALFPSMTASLKHWNDHSKKLKHNIFSNITAPTTTENNNLFLPPHEYEQIPLENDFLILPMITIEEVLNVLFQYIQERNLLDQNDLGSFHLDEKLERLFGQEQETIKLNELRGLVLQNRLVYEKQKQEPHIIIIHLLVKPPTSMIQQDLDVNHIENERKRKRNQIETSDEKHHEEENDLVWYDVDLEVPHLFHTRVRDLLRRIKKRELEYTSSRTKAMGLYRNDHKLFKIRLEEAISNQNSYSKSHIPIHLAAAKACPPGSDAQGSSLCDARMSYLIDQLQNSTQRLAHYHQILQACKNCSTDTNNVPHNN